MSYITEAVVWISYAHDPDVERRLVAPLPFDVARGQSFQPIDMEFAGGSKFFTSKVYAAAFNYVAGSDLESFFLGLPWHEHDAAILKWDTEGEYHGTVEIWRPGD